MVLLELSLVIFSLAVFVLVSCVFLPIIYFLSSFAGAAAGTGILGLSHAMGYGNYKPLMTALREDFTVEERNNLYERLWGRLSGFVVCPLNQAMAYSALTALTRTVENNPEVMENIRNELKETLSKKNMSLA